MRRMRRLIAASVLVAFSGALAGCSNNISSFDPMDWLDWIDTKKKLQGERKPVFPEGVPGLEQGVPKSLYKGASQQEIDQQNAQAAATAASAGGSASAAADAVLAAANAGATADAGGNPFAGAVETAAAAIAHAVSATIRSQQTMSRLKTRTLRT